MEAVKGKKPIDIPDPKRTLMSMNATWRFAHHGGEMEYNKNGVLDAKSPPTVTCEVIDVTTDRVFAKADGFSEGEALLNATRIAIAAPKPKTAAQRAEKNLPIDQQIALKELELQELRAEAAKAVETADLAPKRQSPPKKVTTSLVGLE